MEAGPWKGGEVCLGKMFLFVEEGRGLEEGGGRRERHDWISQRLLSIHVLALLVPRLEEDEDASLFIFLGFCC